MLNSKIKMQNDSEICFTLLKSPFNFAFSIDSIKKSCKKVTTFFLKMLRINFKTLRIFIIIRALIADDSIKVEKI